MKKQIGLVVSAVLLAVFAMVPLASAKTAKECVTEWRADKAGMQARGMTEKAYVDTCKGGGAAPTAASPAPAPTATPKTGAGPATQKTAKECVTEWRADKAGMQARGMSEKAYVDQCRAGGETAAAPMAPKPSVAAPASPPPPAAPAPTAQRPANPTPVARQPSSPSGTSAQSGEFADEAQAKAHCLGDTVVWANLSSKVYHFAGGKTYGNTKRGAYMCEREAVAAQFRAAKNEKHP
jgi:hypothetical protein